ncbi:hypothetical protein ACFLRI_03240 [Bacteroidota bacterium]
MEGFFSSVPDTDLMQAVFAELNKHYSLLEISLNPMNLVPFIGNRQERINQRLLLNSPLESIDENIHKTHRKNIRRAEKAGIQVNTISSQQFLNFKLENKGDYPEDTAVLMELVKILEKQKSIYCLGAYQNEQLVTAILLVHFQNSYTLISSETTPTGKQQKAMFSLIYHVISEKANTDFIFDFEGSSIPGIYEFNNGFGAKDEIYYSININNLPWYLKWMKR